jgi:DNA-binding HxlR family transcriptional regulator
MAEESFKSIFDEIENAQKTMRTFLNSHTHHVPHDQMRIQLELPLLNAVTDVVTKKWAVQILWLLEIKKDVIFNDFVRFFQGISTRSLSDTLKMLEKHELITRTVEDTRPPRVHYALSKKGEVFVEIAMYLVFFLNKDELS